MAIRKKHAYLIIAHANVYVLKHLVKLLDDERNDIYIHVDKKSSTIDFSSIESLIHKSTIQFITNRVDVRWGHVSLVEAELNLLEAASSKQEYSYYHLISGSDLPIKSQDYIHNFFSRTEGKEFVAFSENPLRIQRVDKIYILPKFFKIQNNQFFKRLFDALRWLSIRLQYLVGYHRTAKTKMKYVYGSQWASLTHNAVRDLVTKKSRLLRFYKYAYCPDEIYKQTFIFNSAHKNNVYDFSSEMNGNLRYIDWNRGGPYTFRQEDYLELMNSNCLFARKFEECIDTEIVDKIYHSIK